MSDSTIPSSDEPVVEPAEQQTGGTRAAATSETAGAPEGGTLGSATAESGPERDPEEWVTGDEPMTGPQRSYLDSLARRAGEELPADLTKAQASEHIDRLQEKVDGTS